MAQLVIAAAGAAIGGSLVPGVIGFGITGAQAGLPDAAASFDRVPA